MRLLIVGTLAGHISAAGQIAIARGAKVSHVETVEAGLTALRNGRGADLVMIDVRLSAPRLLEAMKGERINTPVVACGVDPDPEAAEAAIRAGAKEYIPLPPDAELIAAVLAAISEDQSTVIHADPVMAATLKLADQIAPSDASVLVTGESGTGKEVLSRYLHNKSRRKGQNFVSVNCAAIPDNLLESELFGHEKGAFTGAIARRIGKFEEADGGTLLLDEISEMDIRLQAKLLRAIQEREIDRVGGSKPVKVDIRLLATSNRNLEQQVRDGNFREDLYFRLNVFNLRLPALRERPGDIPILAEFFAQKYAEANSLPRRPINAKGEAKLISHKWQGNVRELENTMHRAVLLANGPEIDDSAVMLTGEMANPLLTTDSRSPAAKPPEARQGTESLAETLTETSTTSLVDDPAIASSLVGRTVAEVERDLIIDTLEHCLGNRTHAANILGISIRTLRNKLKQYTDDGLSVPPPGDSERAGV